MEHSKLEAFLDYLNILHDGDVLYNATVTCTNNWFRGIPFENESKIALNILKNFNLENHSRIDEENKPYILSEIQEFADNFDPTKIGHAVAPYLITWNIIRYSSYLTAPDYFSLEDHFQDLTIFLETEKSLLAEGHRKEFSLCKMDRKLVILLFNTVIDKLSKIGEGKQEFIGTIKLLHALFPHSLPLIDGPIGKQKGYEENTVNNYIDWCDYNHDILEKLGQEFIASQTSKNRHPYRQLDLAFMHYWSNISGSMHLKNLGLTT